MTYRITLWAPESTAVARLSALLAENGYEVSRAEQLASLPAPDGAASEELVIVDAGALGPVLGVARALEDERHLLRELLDAIPTPVFYKDAESRYLGCNRAFEQFTGLRRHDIVGKGVFDIAPPHLATVYRRADEDLFASGGTQVYESRVRDDNDDEQDVIFYKAVYRGKDGAGAGLIGTILNITERKRAQDELARLNERLEELVRRRTADLAAALELAEMLNARLRSAQERLIRAEKLAAVGQIAAAVAHDLKNPLSAIYGHAQLMSTGASLEVRERHLETITEEVQRLLDMVEEILAFVRGETAPLREDVELGEFFGDLERSLRDHLQARGIRLVLAGEAVGTAFMDADRMRRVLLNLAYNARDAMPSGGQLTVDRRRAGDRLVVTCADTGPGVSVHIRERLFQEFATHGKSNGTGLGLALCRTVVEAHGGTIQYRSGEAGGAVFVIELPVHRPATG
ncbi:MAG: PAS domain S-box protein [Candidatus Schekmanbacteria bacterium]|nr:PAS domain S-box protein [Candidatus Schekmanbacteria bacterium]